MRCEASRYFSNKKRGYLKDKINELARDSKNMNIRNLDRGINKFKSTYQPRSNLVKDENGGLLADTHNILNTWKNYFSQLLNVYRVSYVMQMGIHTAEQLILDTSPFEVEIAIANLKKCKLPGSGQILTEIIQAVGGTLWSGKLINSIWSKEELPD
jgi:hypothetical protein